MVVFFVSSLTGAGDSRSDSRRVYIVVPRSRSYLKDLLVKAFEGRNGVEVIVDRRSSERRLRQSPVEVERRRAQRRQPKEAMIEVVLEDIAPPKETSATPAYPPM